MSYNVTGVLIRRRKGHRLADLPMPSDNKGQGNLRLLVNPKVRKSKEFFPAAFP